ncbi:MAG: DUF362 domain-containing protein [Verrucomicrobia bacterium]|nr:DUF362 domain-containing protein [Verrucomicrobiota bacterium]
MGDKTRSDGSDTLSRRDFLKQAALGAAAISLGGFASGLPLPSLAATQGGGQQAKAMVIDARSPFWRVEGKINAEKIKAMMDYGIRRLAGKEDAAEAWKLVASPDQVVGIKFNDLSYNYTNANQAILDAIVAGLAVAGVKRENIIVAEAVGAEWKNTKRPERDPFSEPMEVAPGRTTRLTRFITSQIDVLINVPNIKDHGGAGITGCLKGISHSRTIMENPGPYHDNACAPGIVGVNKLEPIRAKRRVNIVNGLLAVYDGGPNPARNQWEHNGFLFATDPVACDRVQIELIEAERKRRGLRGLFERHNQPVHVEQAAKAGLGIGDLNQIDWIKVEEKAEG